MDVCVVFVVRTVAWNVKWHEGRKDLNSTKWIKGEKPRTGKKKKHRGHGCLSVVSVVWCQVEVSAKSWSLVQRSPTDCGVSECDRETSTKRGGPGPYKAVESYKKKIFLALWSRDMTIHLYSSAAMSRSTSLLQTRNKNYKIGNKDLFRNISLILERIKILVYRLYHLRLILILNKFPFTLEILDKYINNILIYSLSF
jgi:hypothetical protein